MNAKPVLILLALLLASCDPPAPPSTGFAGLGQQAGEFAQVERGHGLQFPADHGAHDGFRIEWWYVTANLTDSDGRSWGAQWTLFRSALRPGGEQQGWESPNVWMGHAALSGPFGHQYSETLARGGIGQAGVAVSPFHAWIDDWTLRSLGGDGLQQLEMHATGKDFNYRLQLRSDRPLVLHGDQGYSEKSGQGQASYYYSQPFYQVSGEIERAGQRFSVTGQAWLDREWSSQPLAAGQSGWDWFSLHLDSGAKLMLFQVRQENAAPYRAGTWIAADGQATPLKPEQITLTPLAWTRLANGRRVPTHWRVALSQPTLTVEIQALLPQAWMGTRFPYWEGPVRISGDSNGRGYLEMTGYAP
ncbi:lipocalin-like domain-containing protein [Pseudomonas fontis]|uniref:Iron ABC transporter permease n=1 Tax=Pseudomonas fontis TaxID=2942633 RepID=A0ABT5NKB2_9PSED|nr:lipocalin-like domain-containing protein [Pseudomonas fontis]MDD0976636.1 iron ABC transporter permease [Pseudomonas fontis]MDD0988984.1 iron ABC transporter permease [Pseudomonas fontis]